MSGIRTFWKLRRLKGIPGEIRGRLARAIIENETIVVPVFHAVRDGKQVTKWYLDYSQVIQEVLRKSKTPFTIVRAKLSLREIIGRIQEDGSVRGLKVSNDNIIKYQIDPAKLEQSSNKSYS